MVDGVAGRDGAPVIKSVAQEISPELETAQTQPHCMVVSYVTGT
jgi:hypothetical protein